MTIVLLRLKAATVLLALLCGLWIAVQANAQGAFPALTGRVVDTANLLTPAQESALTAKLSAHETRSGQQVVVATIRSLNGDDIDGYANKLFRAWGLGDKERNDGVLFLVAQNDRKMRIEVGYGLEGVLTDALSAYIIRTAIVPPFRQGKFSVGIEQGTTQILDVLTSDAAALEEWQTRSKPRVTRKNNQQYWPTAVIFGLWFLFFAVPPLGTALAKRFGKKLGPNRYEWLGMEFNTAKRRRRSGTTSSGGTWIGGSGGGGGWSSGRSGGGGFSGGGGSSGGGGASGGW
ncbi:TPM domain-containing protein [Pseudahrensia aquimaris]|uniref:TPM domain-containing protein n=1 Tax=Pseudahrensia aquimaris TaxID=744461 RepID=A0ABW3FKA1_9HYPH